MGAKAAVVLALLVGLAACKEPTIDATSDQSLQQSRDKVRATLPESKRKEFDDAMTVLAMRDVMSTVFGGGTAADATAAGKANLHGKTAEQVISGAAAAISERRAKEKEQATAEIRELQAKLLRAEAAKESLTKFKIVRSQFRKIVDRFGGSEPVVELTVKNETGTPISRAYFEGTIASPDRAVPWLKARFNYQIPGGLEPGEVGVWNLVPNRYSEWGEVNPPKDAILTVSVLQIDGPDGKPIASSLTGDQDRVRLEELVKRFGNP